MRNTRQGSTDVPVFQWKSHRLWSESRAGMAAPQKDTWSRWWTTCGPSPSFTSPWPQFMTLGITACSHSYLCWQLYITEGLQKERILGTEGSECSAKEPGQSQAILMWRSVPQLRIKRHRWRSNVAGFLTYLARGCRCASVTEQSLHRNTCASLTWGCLRSGIMSRLPLRVRIGFQSVLCHVLVSGPKTKFLKLSGLLFLIQKTAITCLSSSHPVVTSITWGNEFENSRRNLTHYTLWLLFWTKL